MINQSHNQSQSSHLSRSSAKGMTLIEMMIVVVIITVLTTLALMGYKRLIYQARNAEARNFLGAIRAAQNVYYQLHGQYAGTLEWAEWPRNFPVESKVNWDNPDSPTWQHLNVRPQGPVWFKYRIKASVRPADAPGEAFRPPPNGPWFQAQARSDFNGDNQFSILEITSATSNIYVERLNE